MKIKKIFIQKYLMIENLELNFFNEMGTYDTVVFAGENGTGKTTILSLLFSLLNADLTKLINLHFLGNIEYLILPEEWKAIKESIAKIFGNNWLATSDDITINRIKLEINSTIVNTAGKWSGFKILLYNEDTLIKEADHSVVLECLCLRNARFQGAEIDFTPQKIVSVTASDIDNIEKSYKKSDSTLSTKIAQLLVDIDTNDARDMANWIDHNPGKTMPDDIKHERINRFNNAFKKIFSNLSFSRILASDGEQKILFCNYGHDVLLTNLSSGEKQIIFRGGFFLENIKNIMTSIAFIDEPELSLHPKWQKKILSYYREILNTNKGNAQLFVATHSPFIVHSEMENTKYIILKRNSIGKIMITDNATFPDFSEEKLVQEAFNINWYRQEEEKILFVEDGAHKIILEELLKNNKEFKIAPIGPCDKVLSCSEALREKDNFFFLVDGDRKRGLDTTKKYAKHTHRLSKYCIENYLFDEGVLSNVISFLGKSITPEDLLRNVVNGYNCCDAKFDIIKTLFECNQFSFEKLDNTDCSELVKQLGRNEFLAQKQYDLIRIFMQEAKKLGKFEELFSEVLDFLRVNHD